MDVIIVSKTQMTNATCVGGVLANGNFVRLLDSNGRNQSSDTRFKVGDVYTITYSTPTNKKPPHVEDIFLKSFKYKFTFSTSKMVKYLKNKLKIKIWEGSTEKLFEGNLLWTNNGSGYISESNGIPENSVGFWVPDKDLLRKYYNEKVKYSYPIRWRNIPFVGLQNPVSKIPAGTLVRVSLARWWSPDDNEERCYLQLSGWYELIKSRATDDEGYDLPF